MVPQVAYIILDRSALSGFGMMKFATKEDLNKRKQVILKTVVCLNKKIKKLTKNKKC